MVLFEKEEVIPSLLLGDESTVGFDRVRRVPDDQHSSQVQTRQVRRDGGLLIGVARHGNLIDESLAGSLEIHQHQRFLRFGLLQLHRRIHRRRGLDQRRIFRQPCGRRIGILDRLAIQVQDLERLWT